MSWEDIRKSQVEEEEFEDLSLEEKFDFIAEWMEVVVKEIIQLTEKIVVWRNGINEDEERVKAVVKSFEGVVVRKSLIRDILKGKAKSSLDKEFFRKEKSKLKKITQGWYVI